MTESRYFFCHTPKRWGGTVPPLQKVAGTRTPRTPLSYAYVSTHYECCGITVLIDWMDLQILCR